MLTIAARIVRARGNSQATAAAIVPLLFASGTTRATAAGRGALTLARGIAAGLASACLCYRAVDC
jgi:hypothetical protein